MSAFPRRHHLLLCSATLLAACAALPQLGEVPKVAAPDQFSSPQSFAGPVAQWPSDRWWTAYGDSQLDALIEEALQGSPTLAAAAARVRQAQAQLQQAGAARGPSVTGQTAVETSRQSLSADNITDVIRDAVPDDWSTHQSAAIQVGYQLDFFGRNRAAFASATSAAEAAAAEAAASRLQLSASVALAYADFVRYGADVAALQRIVALRQESFDLVTQRVTQGIENEGLAHQARAELAAARADLDAAEGAVARTRNALAALLGKGPDRGLSIAMPAQPKLTGFGVPADLELNLIGRRPDLVAARERVEAAAAQIKVARADFYPNVNLAAVVGIQTIGLARLGSGSVSFAQAGPAMSLPIFTAGRIQGAYRQARAEYDEAVALYDQTLVKALKEAADAVVDRRALDRQLVNARDALTASEAAYAIARRRYEGGLTSYIDTLSIEDGLVAQRRAVTALEAQAFALDIALVKAVGGGFAES